jgi:hypothetical protein
MAVTTFNGNSPSNMPIGMVIAMVIVMATRIVVDPKPT